MIDSDLNPKHPYPNPTTWVFSEQNRVTPRHWPQWHDIYPALEELGLAQPGYRLIESGFGPIDIEIAGYGYGRFKCEPQIPLAEKRGRNGGRPHRLKVFCTCGTWVFFGKLNQHFPSQRHADLRAKAVAK
jgi:hypothetical protein